MRRPNRSSCTNTRLPNTALFRSGNWMCGLAASSRGNDAYPLHSGTSSASPNIAGSLLLLQELYALRHDGAFMRAATLKGLAIHTAGEAGPSPGPDYRFGWGVLNTASAAEEIGRAHV